MNIKAKSGNIVFGCIFFLLAILIYIKSTLMQHVGTTYLGPDFWPKALAVLIGICGASVVLQAFLSEDESLIKLDNIKLSISALLVWVCYLILIIYTSYFLITPLLFILLSRILGYRNWKVSILTGILYTISIYIVFRIILELPIN